MKKVVSLSVLSLFMVACASHNTLEESADTINEEPIHYLDLTLEETKGLLKEYWVEVSRKNPRYPMSAVSARQSGCVNLIIGINSDGRASGYRVIKSYPEGVFDNYAIAALTEWQWVAADTNSDKTPVLTTIQLDFSMSESSNRKEAENQCRVG
ncbi:energy transducer TonB [Alkalimonas collagenimarina]|uniref:Energy transducer TonB n=1 Tax=Alkalimonas collagenimarina TaxID=400390 RepID=A0ABT9H240_9GAMM|nr:energy transducer TonB [Alkalimonas collagenimarina]MDP4537371.1 energy transducer TonB [Alkalimonas collagenimarina]